MRLSEQCTLISYEIIMAVKSNELQDFQGSEN